jgi:predicted esterase
MTRQDRDLVITDNLAYVDAVLERLHAEFGSSSRIVYAGFSQGVAMAFRAACLGAAAVREVIAMGGDVPPDLAPEQLRRLQRVLIGRGLKDDWYSAAKFDEDQRRLREARIDVTLAALDIGHEWTGEFSRAAGEFVRGQP